MRVVLRLLLENIREAALLAVFGIIAVVLGGCVNDVMPDDPYAGYGGIRFRATVGEPDRPSTRANNSLFNVTNEFYDTDFYVRVQGLDNSGLEKQEMSTYVIPSGSEGVIMPKIIDVVDDKEITEKELNWFSRMHPHEFWGWTMPFDTVYTPEEETLEQGVEINFPNTPIAEKSNTYPYPWNEGSFANGAVLENFIGGKVGPFVYNDNGIYVPLRMRHLISKIFLMKFIVVDNRGGSSTSNLKGEITFYGMPHTAMFYPCPQEKDGEGNYIQPYVTIPEDWDYDQTDGVTYTIFNNSTNYKWEGKDWGSSSYWPKDCWWIPPELDFSKMSYKIVIYEYVNKEWQVSQTHGKHGAYYGDFSNITFSRTGTGYDNMDDPGSDATTLHAGEYLQLEFTIYEKGNAGVQGIITAWAGNTDRDGSAHVHQGLYSLEQVRDMSTVMNGTDEQKKREFYELYGSGRDTGDDPEGEYPDYEEIFGEELEIFELFDDIGYETATSSTASKVGPTFTPGAGYILDGMGHTVNVTTTSMTIGIMRDVYLRYYVNNGGTPQTYTEYIVYIDKDGQVWTVDPVTFEETMTEWNVNTSGSNPMKLNMINGKIG